MKKLVTNFLLLIFCSVPRILMGQMGIDKVKMANEEKMLPPKFIDNISFVPTSPLQIVAGSNEFIKGAKPINTVDETVGIEKVSSWQAKYAMLLEVDIESIKNSLLYKFIDSWFGIRYRMGGTSRLGIDCSAFTDSLLSTVYSLILPRTAKEQYYSSRHISKDELSEGDLVFFNTHGGISHVGVYLANGRFVHSSSSQGVMISSLFDNYYSRRFVGAGRVETAAIVGRQ